MTRFSSIFSQLLQLFPRLEFEQAVKKHNAERGAKGFSSWGPVCGDAVLPVWAGAFVAGDLRRIGQLRREAEASGDTRGTEEIDAGICKPAPAMGAVSDRVRAGADQMPVNGVVIGIQEEVQVQEQAGEPGLQHDRSVLVDV